jgi:hypothetical protein
VRLRPEPRQRHGEPLQRAGSAAHVLVPVAAIKTDDSCDDSHRKILKLKVNIQPATLVGVRSSPLRAKSEVGIGIASHKTYEARLTAIEGNKVNLMRVSHCRARCGSPRYHSKV